MLAIFWQQFAILNPPICSFSEVVCHFKSPEICSLPELIYSRANPFETGNVTITQEQAGAASLVQLQLEG
jgi:hypothetical protein